MTLTPYPETTNPTRRALIQQMIDCSHGRDPVSPGFWAMVWLSDLETLRQYVCSWVNGGDCGRGKDPKYVEWSGVLSTWAECAYEDCAEASVISTHRYRSWKWMIPGRQKCRERDRRTCRITNARISTQATPIWPSSLRVNQAVAMYRTLRLHLTSFWPPDLLEKWEAIVSGHEDTDTVTNLVCLSPNVAEMWASARFALKPLEISEDQRTLKLEFWWLAPAKSSPRYLDEAPIAPGNLTSDGQGTRLHNDGAEYSKCIRSGDIVHMTTPDPENLPLPSFELLMARWHLNRLIALSGVLEGRDRERDFPIRETDQSMEGDGSGRHSDGDEGSEWDLLEDETVDESTQDTNGSRIP